jgi:hypothetical protein
LSFTAFITGGLELVTVACVRRSFGLLALAPALGQPVFSFLEREGKLASSLFGVGDVMGAA